MIGASEHVSSDGSALQSRIYLNAVLFPLLVALLESYLS